MLLHYLAGTAGWVRTATDLLLILHVAAGGVGVTAGAVALAARKGERWHRLAGTTFFISMFALGSTAAVIGIVLDEVGNVFGGVFTCYLTTTSWMTVRRPEGHVGRFEVASMFVAFAVAALAALGAVQGAKAHVALPLVIASTVMAAIALAAGAGDLSVVLRRGLFGAQRIARHLWRMCLGFFIAAAAFVTQPRMFPSPSPIMLAAASLPLVLMIYWLLRVALTDQFKRAGAALSTQVS